MAEPSGSPAERHEPRLVVVGAGFGGLTLVQHLREAAFRITLVDRHNYHLFQPLLYQVATAALSPADIATPIRHVLSKQKNAAILLDTVTGADVAAKRVLLATEGALPFDFLVLATGSVYNYFGHEDWRSAAPGLKNIDDATYIRRRVLLAFERAETADDATRARLLTFVLIGAGPTGVELAGALAELARAALAEDFRNINPRGARIILVEAAPRLLAGFSDRLARFAETKLKQMGVEIRLGAPITVIDAHGVVAGGERIEAATVIWCAGVQATPVARWLGVRAAKGGRVEVEPDLSVSGHPDIFVIGDAASGVDRAGRPWPGVAVVAKQQGRYLAELFRRRLAGARPPPAFRYRNEGMLAIIGRSAAIAQLPYLKLAGRLAWLLWGIVHIYFLVGFRNRISVFTQWVWAWFTYARGARLITGDDRRP